jgi:hypothetical protein
MIDSFTVSTSPFQITIGYFLFKISYYFYSSNKRMADRRKAVSSILRFGAGKDTLPALPVIFQIGAGMVGPEWYRAGTSETHCKTVKRLTEI